VTLGSARLFRNLTARLDARFAMLGAAVFLEAAGMGALYPLLAKIQTEHHLATYALGLMSGANFFAALVAQLGVGRFLDGQRARRVLLIGLAVGSVSLVWFARSGDLWQLVASRALSGIGYGIVGPASLREAAVGVDGERRGQRLGVLSSMMMAGIVIGPLAGSLLALLGGVPLPFEVLAALLGMLFVAVAAVPHSPRDDLDREPGPVVTAPRFTSRAVVAVLLFSGASQLPNGLYDSLWSRLLTDRGADELLIGLSLSLFGLPFILLAPIGGRIAERRGPLLAATVALIISDVFMASYGFVPSPVVITLLGVAEACAQCVAIPGGYAAVARLFPESRAATGQGWFSGAGTAAAGLSAVAGAPLYAALGPGATFGGGAVISVLIALSSLVVAGRSTPTSHPGEAAHSPPPAGNPHLDVEGRSGAT
jgi:DHA1 family multidrug resistance protein-like MFS transporter